MTSKRKLKKAVNSLANQLVNECNVYTKFNANSDIEKIKALKDEIISKRNEILSAINSEVDAQARKKHFQKIVNDFQSSMVPILDKLVK
jgi:hypothetical protein